MAISIVSLGPAQAGGEETSADRFREVLYIAIVAPKYSHERSEGISKAIYNPLPAEHRRLDGGVQGKVLRTPIFLQAVRTNGPLYITLA